MLLELEDLEVGYGERSVLHGISLGIESGEIVALLGANGAGKSTTLRAISQLLHPTRGAVRFEGRDLVGCTPERVVARGLAHVPEGRKIFPGLTVLDNVRLGATPRGRVPKAELDADIEHAFSLFPKLRDMTGKLGWMLSGGEQQMLAIARGIMAKPKLLLLDEPSLGLAPLIVKSVMETIAAIAQAGTTVLLVEQNANLALAISNRAYVLETGRIVLEGPAKALLADPQMRGAYLGGAARAKAGAPAVGS